MYIFTIALCLISFIVPSISQRQSIANQQSPLCITPSYTMPLFSTRILRKSLNRTRINQLDIRLIRLHASIVDEKVAVFQNHRDKIKRGFHLFNNTKQHDKIIIYNLKLHAKYMNSTNLNYVIEIITRKNHTYSASCSLNLTITRPQRLIDQIFELLIPVLIICTSFQMGISFNLKLLKQSTHRFLQILISLVCQYVFMPLLSFSISKLFQYQPWHGLGLFIVACCPTGAICNQLMVLFDGDLDLSAIMSFISMFTLCFMMPLWLYTFGQYAYLGELKIHIPLFKLMQSLLVIVLPYELGILTNYFLPKLNIMIRRLVQPTLFILFFYVLIFSGIVNFYLLNYISFKTALSASFLPWLGYMLGCLVAWICKQDRKRIITIGIETGTQNVTNTFMVLLYSLPAIDNSQAIAIPLIIASLSMLPSNVILIYRLIRLKCCRKTPISRHKSIDTLSKTTFHISETEDEIVNDLSLTGNVSLPMTVFDSSIHPLATQNVSNT